MTGRRARGVAARWVVAAAIAIIASLAAPARAQWERNGDGDVQRWSPRDFVAAIDRAGAVIPRDRVLDAWQSYLADWASASDAIVPDRVAVMMRGFGDSLLESAEAIAARVALERRAASASARIERALVDRVAEGASPEVRARLDALLRDRQLARALGDAGLALGLPGGLETAPVEAIVADAFRTDPVARAAADAALEPTRAARLAAAGRLVAARADGMEARRRVLEAAGWSVSRDAFIEIMERDRREPDADADDAGDGQTWCTPGSEGDRLLRALQDAGRAESAPLAKPVAQLTAEQVKAIRAAMQAVSGPARERLARQLARDLSDLGQRFPGRRLYMTIARSDLPAACEPCLRDARDRWCEELARIVDDILADAMREESAGAAGAPFGTDQVWSRRTERTERFSEACDAAVERLLAACPATCRLPEPEGDGEPPVRYSSRRLRGFAEFDALAEGEWRESVGDADDDAPAGGDADADAADPFDLGHTPELLGRAPSSAAIVAALARCGVPADRMPAIEAIRSQADEERQSTVGAAVGRYEDAANAIQAHDPDSPDSASPEKSVAAARAALPVMFDALRVHDERFGDSVVAAAGLDDGAARIFRLWLALGDSRSESITMASGGDEGQGGLRLNPAEAVLSTDLSVAARTAAFASLARHAPALEARFRAWRRTAFDGELAVRVAGVAAMSREGKERLAAMKDYRATVRDAAAGIDAARDAHDAEARATIDEALVAMPPEDAAALRRTVLRRRFPELFLDEELVRASVADVLDRLPDEDVGTRLSLARTLDGWAALAGSWRAGTLERSDRPRAVFKGLSDGSTMPSTESLDASMRVGLRHGGAEMLLQLAVERLALAASIDTLEASPKFRALAARAAIPSGELRDRAALSSSP